MLRVTRLLGGLLRYRNILALALLLLAAPAFADDGVCADPLDVQQRWEGRQIMVSVVVALQSPGSVYVCPMLPANMAGVRFVLRRKLPPELGLPDPVIDSCVSAQDEGSHPVDGFARAQIRDTAGSYMCLVGPDTEGTWTMVPSRMQYLRATWYLTP